MIVVVVMRRRMTNMMIRTRVESATLPSSYFLWAAKARQARHQFTLSHFSSAVASRFSCWVVPIASDTRCLSLLAPKVLSENLWLMITTPFNPILSYPSPHITLKTTWVDCQWPKMTKIQKDRNIFWFIELNDQWSKKICTPKIIFWSSATFIFSWSCFSVI